MTSRTRVLLTALLVVILGASAIRLAGGAHWLARRALQADFSAYYVAGKSMNRGLSPYRNHAGQDPALWDGVGFWEQSRFLYPPLAATPFRVLAALPYRPAKAIWTGLTVFLAALALVLSARVARTRSVLVFLGAGIWILAGWPFWLELERGQIDLLTLALVLAAALVGRERGHGRAALAGGLWALAGVFKLHVVLALPFLLLRRRFDVVAGALLAAAVLLGASRLTMPEDTRAYLTEVMPRLVKHGINPPAGTLLPPAVRASLFRGTPPMVAHAHGENYLRFAVTFDDHASLVWALAGEEARYPGLLSLLIAGLMIGAVAFVTRGRAGPASAPSDDAAWWVLALCCVLLAAPLTWPMNAVWLLPAVFVVLARPAPSPRWLHPHYVTALGVFGLVLVALPDRFAWPWPRVLHGLSSYKYVLGETAVAAAMLARLARPGRGADGEARASGI